MAAGLGFKDFVTGEVLTAADVDGYLMQGVWVFASAAARDAVVTSPQEGNFAYLKDTNVTTYYTGSAWANLDTTGMTNPMTTTGDIIYSSPGSTPVRLGIGSTGNVLTVASGVPSWAAPAGGGKVLQVVYGSTTTGVSNATSTYADTGLTASITPSLSSSKVAVFVSQNGMGKNNDGGITTNAVNCKLFRGATEISYIQMMGYSEDNSLDLGMSWSTNILDTPATTSSTTYKVQFANSRNGNGVEAQYGSSRSSIILMEIGA